MIAIQLILITVVLVLGMKVATSKDMILEKLGNWAEGKVEEGYKYFELLICPWCMPSLFSIFAHGFALGLDILPPEFNWQLIVRWPLVIMASSFITGFIWTVYLTLNSIKEKNDLIVESKNDD